MITRNLYRRPMRTSLTAIGVAVGVVAIVSFSTIVHGLWDSVEGTIHINDADLLVFQADIAADILSVLDEDKTRAALLAVPGVERAVGALWHVLPVGRQPFCLTVGLHIADVGHGKSKLLRGRYPAEEHEVLLGKIAARVLETDVEETLEIYGETYTVVGIFESGVVFVDGALIMNLGRLQEISGKEGQVTVFQVHTTPGVDIDAITDEIEKQNPNVVAIGNAGEYHKADQGLEIANGMVWAVTFLAIIVGGIVVANTMWLSVSERTREIGVLRAVGWSQARIVLMIILEASGVGLIGTLLGCPAGICLAKLTTYLPVSSQFISPVFDAGPFMLALSVAVVLSVLGAAIPAWRAARISPAEALRYE